MDFETLVGALGQVVRERRAEAGFSQESFAFKVGIHRTYVGAVERGERNLSLQNMLRIAEALGVRVSELLAEAESRARPKRGRRRQR